MGEEGKTPRIFNLTPRPLYLHGRAPCTHWIGVLDPVAGKRTPPLPIPVIEPR
jgi:hypothetical protein